MKISMAITHLIKLRMMRSEDQHGLTVKQIRLRINALNFMYDDKKREAGKSVSIKWWRILLKDNHFSSILTNSS